MNVPSTTTAALASAALALTGALTAVSAQAAPPPDPDPQRTYEVTADLDARLSPRKNDIFITDWLKDGQRVHIECQAYGEPAYGSRIWDLVSEIGRPAFTKFVPDRFIKTGTSGRAPEIRRCGKDEE
jgi:hypothetical protein